MSSESGRERDLVLAPNEFAFILDETKGHVIAYVGPHKTSLANTDRPVLFDAMSRRYRRCSLEEAITPFPFAEEGWYVVLENPARAGEEEHAKSGPNNLPKLILGRKINIPGPTTFPLWPGQVARVIQGHHLRSNQYLVVKVYNEEAARENWSQAVIKPREDAVPDEVPDLTLGKMLVIKGTEVSFYIPPTGVEVLEDNGVYVRNAVTLERLEYCILLDEDGNKRFIEGPDVVFPEPTERFIEKNGHTKFKAIELNEISGLYLKVIAPYEDHKVGEELFITGRDQMIYFPRPEHALIRYGDQTGEVHHAVAIPAGQGRYVLQRLTGEVLLKRGPCMFLPDPRKEVLVRRVLSASECHLMYPGNQEVLEYNQRLAGARGADTPREKRAMANVPASLEAVDEFTRSQRFTGARTITLDNRFDGAVSVSVWTGYAVQVVNKTGERRVEVGPANVLLEYSETLEAMELSTGTPKTDDLLLKTVYLRVINNKVSDLIEAETSDLCQVSVHLSYRVNFEGDPARWFNVENFVKFLTDHLRSIVRHVVKQKGIEDFYSQAVTIVRDAILGPSGPEGRPGRFFAENGMRVYDVDVLDVTIGDKTIAGMLTSAQHGTVRQTLTLAQEQKQLEVTQRTEKLKQQAAQAHFETTVQGFQLQLEEVVRGVEVSMARVDAEAQVEERKVAHQEALGKVQELALAREKARKDMELAVAREALEQRLVELKAEVEAARARAEAFSPGLVAALQAFGDQHLAGKLAESMAPLAIMGGKSIAEVFASLVKGTPLEGALRSNGHAAPV